MRSGWAILLSLRKKDNMPYRISYRDGKKPWKIVRADTGKVVGSSDSHEKAARSIGYRQSGEKKK